MSPWEGDPDVGAALWAVDGASVAAVRRRDRFDQGEAKAAARLARACPSAAGEALERCVEQLLGKAWALVAHV